MKTISKKSRNKIQYYLAWAILIITESIVAAIPVILLGLIIIPLSKSTRTCDCLGGEILLLCFAYWFVFTKIHHFVYDKIFDTKDKKEGK